MESVKDFFFHNWGRKAVAVISAIIIWFFVNHSILETKTIPNVPVKIVNLAPDKTVLGLLSNGILERRMTLTLTGTKDVIQDLEPGDVQVLLDASTADSDDWVVRISKKNLVSLNPAINLLQHITAVDHAEFVIKLTKLVTAKIPILVMPPVGNPPEGYEYLDVWPQKLMQTLSGPREEIERLKNKGLKLTFNLDKIASADLDKLSNDPSHTYDDEISFPVPEKWKQVAIPFRQYAMEEINDPEAANLRIDFLRKKLLPLKQELPVQVFYPFKNSSDINPHTYSLSFQGPIIEKNGISIFSVPLYVKDVSRLFLDIIRDNLQIVVIAAPKDEREILQWSIEIIDAHALEDTYVAYSLSALPEDKNVSALSSKRQETLLRERFREYVQRLALYVTPDRKLLLDSRLDDNQIKVQIGK
ncbi:MULTISPECIES: CdaR family protein [Parachlamydia]|jgi:hypothetical protein|uniref:CdaR family protein n=1 Tax=Parachlamydia TaxID=83551 RepID=UPI0001C17504|nr:hypothetical protein [Parachlamydia acanthamoebae]EFB41155.1 hypothetical protein pah_c050o136 [Parachlamydia acanthamoebae str. Hall's coccus]